MNFITVHNILYADNHEPDTIINRLRTTTNTAKVALNDNDKADYYWIDPMGNERMYERKQLGEALSDLDSLEEQLHRHLGSCDELSLIIEGVGRATQDGVQIYKKASYGWTVKGAHTFKKQPGLWARWEGLKWSLWHECGVYVVEVSSWEETVWHLQTAFKASYVKEHTTLKRYTVPHVVQFDKNRHVDNLIRLKGCRIGVATAEKLVDRFGTFRHVMSAPREMLEELMGQAWTDNFMKYTGGD